MAKLFSKYKMTKADGSYILEIAKIEPQDFLILDDFGLLPIDNQNRSAMMEIIEDAILDMIVHDAHRIELIGESMRNTINFLVQMALQGNHPF
jgi:hypothetical protein